MKRRSFVLASALGGLTSAAAAPPHQHDPIKRRPSSKELKAVASSAFDCLRTAEVCLAQCTAVLAAGNTSMADCQRSVLNMIAVCDAMARAATYNTAEGARLKTLARVCADFCRDCEKECQRHAEAHSECKECMESCQACARACDAYVKAA